MLVTKEDLKQKVGGQDYVEYRLIDRYGNCLGCAFVFTNEAVEKGSAVVGFKSDIECSWRKVNFDGSHDV